MKNLLNLLKNQSINISLIWSDASIVIAALLLILVLILYFYAKDLRDLIAETKDELNHKVESYNLLYKTSEDRIAYCRNVTQAIESKNNELIVESLEKDKQIFSDKDAIEKFIIYIQERDERINKLTSQVKKTKYVPLNQQKEAEGDLWECTSEGYKPNEFLFEKTYRQVQPKSNAFMADHLLWLMGEDGKEYEVAKFEFKPAKP